MDAPSPDTLMRLAAFECVRGLNETHDHLTAKELKPGFLFRGERIPLVNPQRGIFKPQQMRFLLSIKTVFCIAFRIRFYVNNFFYTRCDDVFCAHMARECCAIESCTSDRAPGSRSIANCGHLRVDHSSKLNQVHELGFS